MMKECILLFPMSGIKPLDCKAVNFTTVFSVMNNLDLFLVEFERHNLTRKFVNCQSDLTVSNAQRHKRVTFWIVIFYRISDR